jgi:hypothetical protein
MHNLIEVSGVGWMTPFSSTNVRLSVDG